jgi:catechol 2,3-dioxygenase-like lactoylglutathione lyase family enzyme
MDGGWPRRLNGRMSDAIRPALRSVVLDTTDPHRLAEFYHQLLGYPYGPEFEPPTGDEAGDEVDWVLLEISPGGPHLAFQQVDELPESTWPTTDVPQQMHLDLTVPDREVLEEQHRRALALGARLLLDDSDDPEEPIYIYADPDGHPFCIFVKAG